MPIPPQLPEELAATGHQDGKFRIHFQRVTFASLCSWDLPDLGKRIPRRILVPIVLQNVRQILRNLLPMHRRHKRKHRVDPRRHTRSGPHISVHDPPGDGHPLRPRKLVAELRPRRLVRRRLPPVEHARAREEARAGAHGDERVQARVGRLDEGDGVVPWVFGARAEPARYKKYVEVRWRGGEGVGWNDGFAKGLFAGVERSGDRIEGRGDDGEGDRLGLSESVENVKWPKGVECLEAWEEDYPIFGRRI